MRPIVDQFFPPAGWYSLDDGARYWDGNRWTGDYRPPRLPKFAAEAHRRSLGISLVGAGIGLVTLGLLSFWHAELTPWGWQSEGFIDDLSAVVDPPSSFVLFLQALATFSVCLLSGSTLAAGGTYFLRGRGPTTRAVKQRLAQERRSETGKRWAGAALALGLKALAAGEHRRSIERIEGLRKLEGMAEQGLISREQFEKQRDLLFPE